MGKMVSSVISLIIPCYNEEAVLHTFYQEATRVLDSCPFNIEFIFINDGSSDRTLEILKHLAL